ncbi:MAG: hypothetical protein WC248_04480 [Candidatus Methanomethylophilaceae archaeon]
MEVIGGFRKRKVIEDERVKFIGVMLAGVDKGEWDGLFDAGMDEWREFDDFRAGTEDEGNIRIHF